MKVCVFGAGAIGSHVALRLAGGGAQVSVVARGAQLDAIRSRGITGRTPDGELHADVSASADPQALGPQDAVVVTVKAPSLPSVAHAIGPLLGPETPVAFVMNGIPWWYFHAHGGALDGRRLPRLDPDDALWRAIGPERVIGGVVNSPSTVVEPGIVLVGRRTSSLTLGEPDGTLSARARALADVLTAGGMTAAVSNDIRSVIWEKLTTNLMSGPLTILSQSAYREVFAEPACCDAALRIMAEVSAVARALGRHTDPDHAKRIESNRLMAHKPSILQDLELGRPMEVDALLTTTLEMARLTGVQTPTLDLLVALVRLRAKAAGLYQESPAPAS
jgi:2-dehydropantoate 2-reductase